MKKYNCNRCNKYSTDCRKAFWQHQNKTKKCSKKKESTKNDTESIQNPPISFQLFSRTCKYCNKVFSTNSNMHKHMKRSCKIRKASGLTTETKRKRYNCDRCNKYSTDCRQNFWSHQNRTKKCGNKDEI